MLRLGLFAFVLSAWAATASADTWADKLFAQRSHDFGAVARAAKVEYEFVVTNPYNEDIHLSSVRSSCGCTLPRIEKDTIKPGESSAVIAEFNTRAFTGQRSARVTVTIDKPRYTEVQLEVKGYIRTDIVLNPSLVNFGSLTEGQAADKTVKIEYAGRNDWQITGVKAASPYLDATIKETSRANGRAAYQLDVQLKEGAPAGYINEELILTTNDRRATQFPVTVEGRIVPELSVSPTPLVLGTVRPGQKIKKQIVVKGATPFRVVDIRCDNEGFQFDIPSEAKTVHLIPVTFEAGATTGKLNEQIVILTDLGDGKTAELSAIGQISAPLAGN